MNLSQVKFDPVVSQTDLNDLIIDAIQDIKGKDIVKIDMCEIDDAPTNFFIICTGESVTQIKSISKNISSRVREELGLNPNHREGMDGAKWVLVDYFNTVVHIFHPETREFYDLEDLWSDGTTVEYEDI